MPEMFVVICGDSQRSLKSFLVIARNLGGVGALQIVSELTRDYELSKWMESTWTVTQQSKDTECGPPVKRTRKSIS